ncbi:hypothetical protein EMGBS8_10980, partial [Verrucomicrobiota bacterium]
MDLDDHAESWSGDVYPGRYERLRAGRSPAGRFSARHAAGWEVLSGPERKPIAADDFVLLPNPGPAWPAPERLVIRLR